MSLSFRVAEKVTLVTGASRGVGGRDCRCAPGCRGERCRHEPRPGVR
jgi:hypothetical protein